MKFISFLSLSLLSLASFGQTSSESNEALKKAKEDCIKPYRVKISATKTVNTKTPAEPYGICLGSEHLGENIQTAEAAVNIATSVPFNSSKSTYLFTLDKQLSRDVVKNLCRQQKILQRKMNISAIIVWGIKKTSKIEECALYSKYINTNKKFIEEFYDIDEDR